MEQIIAAGIFIVMFILIIWDKIERHIVTLACGIATIVFVFIVCMGSVQTVLDTIAIEQIFTMEFWYHVGASSESHGGINWATIIFIAGMMVMVEGMARVGFFRWMCMAIAKLVRYRPVPILVAFMIVSAVLAMFIDSITVILFLAAVTIELSKIVKFDPVPVIMAEIFCANLGGSATMCGDPPNIIIGTALDYSFADFVANTGIAASISMVFIILFFFFCFRKELSSAKDGKGLRTAGTLVTRAIADDNNTPPVVITDKRGFLINSLIFLLAVVLLITHAQTGLTVAFIGTVIAVLTLLAAGKHAREVISKVDYKTLLFFIGLFVVVGGLEQTGVLVVIADFIGSISGGNAFVMAVIILWISGIASAFVDNIPFAATMVPVIKSLSLIPGVNLDVLAWSLAIGTDIGGSATPIGASANVVGVSVASQNGYKISWGRYCKFMVPASIIVMAISTAYIWMRYF